MTRRGLLGPLLAAPSLLALGGCAGGLRDVTKEGQGPTVHQGPSSPGLIATRMPYGAQPRQTIDVYGNVHGHGWPEAPVVVAFGAAPDVDTQAATALAMELAARGCLVFLADYPLRETGRFPAQTADAAAAFVTALQWARTWGVEGRRAGVVGLSAGAWLAAMLALDRRYLASRGRGDPIRAAACLGGPYDFIPLADNAGRDAFGREPDLTFTRPTAYARSDAPELWLGHGLNDQVAAPEHARRLHARIQAAGGSSTLRLYADHDHAQSLNSPEVLSDMAAFLIERL